MGRALWLRGEDEASIRELNEAIGLSPNFALAHYQLGFVQAQTGDAQAAVEAVEVARQLSPFDPMLYAMCAARAWALFRLERFEEAGEWALNTIRQPNASLHGCTRRWRGSTSTWSPPQAVQSRVGSPLLGMPATTC